MGLAKKCDRCGVLYEPKEITFKSLSNVSHNGTTANGVALIRMNYNNVNYSNSGLFDLCPTCLKSLSHWFEAKDEKDSQL